MPEYTYDVKLFAAIRVEAPSESDALRLLRESLDCTDCDLGVWPNDDPILAEASMDGEPDLVEIDGEAI